ncbi:MAG: hypothetical protein N2445_04120, partial [Acidobacteria bacterium]|nr:hypothetical protein [Acidobacteriota bacterium]
MDEYKQDPEIVQESCEKRESCIFKSALGVFIEPTKTFPIVAEKKMWVFFPIVLLFLSTFFTTFLFFERVDREA